MAFHGSAFLDARAVVRGGFEKPLLQQNCSTTAESIVVGHNPGGRLDCNWPASIPINEENMKTHQKDFRGGATWLSIAVVLVALTVTSPSTPHFSESRGCGKPCGWPNANQPTSHKDPMSQHHTAARATTAEESSPQSRIAWDNPAPAATPRTTMNGKPVFTVSAKTVVNFDSGFKEKLLCDGLTFTAGTTCAFSCPYCYVETQMVKNAEVQRIFRETHLGFQDFVARRENPVGLLRKQLTNTKGELRFTDPNDTRVIYASPLVDVAANVELADETAAMVKVILELTNWQVRLLSKSPLLLKIAAQIPEASQDRVIYGLSTGTLDDGIARAVERSTPLVSKRIAALHELQDRGLRTFGMACPILPQVNPQAYANQVVETLRTDRCEHVWAEVLNVRGESMTKTLNALTEAGYPSEANLLNQVSSDKAVWENYARGTFQALAEVIPAEKLRFLQYVTKGTREWWQAHENQGAVLLGRAAEINTVTV